MAIHIFSFACFLVAIIANCDLFIELLHADRTLIPLQLKKLRKHQRCNSRVASQNHLVLFYK